MIKRSKSTSFVKIEMTVFAPLWNESDVAPAFMDAQYAGYIGLNSSSIRVLSFQPDKESV